MASEIVQRVHQAVDGQFCHRDRQRRLLGGFCGERHRTRRRQAASPSWMRSVISISGGFGAVLGGVAGVSFRQLAGRMEMSIAEADYLEKNRSSWQYGYDAPNVESWVFRWKGRIPRQ